MAEYLLCVVASDSPLVPARICGLLAQRNITANSIQITKPPGWQHWWIQLVICAESPGEAELTVKRLNRLTDVVKVVDVSSGLGHQRRSVFVKVRPAADQLVHVSEITRLFKAEVLDVATDLTTLHLSATPDRCAEFLSMLVPYGVVETVPSAVSGARSGFTGLSSLMPPAAVPRRSDRLTSVRLKA